MTRHEIYSDMTSFIVKNSLQVETVAIIRQPWAKLCGCFSHLSNKKQCLVDTGVDWPRLSLSGTLDVAI